MQAIDNTGVTGALRANCKGDESNALKSTKKAMVITALAKNWGATSRKAVVHKAKGNRYARVS